MNDFDDFYYNDFKGPVYERDTKIDEAKRYLKEFFQKNYKQVFYIKQLEVMFEKNFFHWIIAKALGELIDEGYMKMVEMPLSVEVRG